MTIDLDNYRKNVHSQGGEDGIIQKIMEEANLTGELSSEYFVEFGAWDGIFLSNACRLAETGWKGVFIEANPERFKDLQSNYSSEGIDLVNEFVAANGENSLENILQSKTQFGGQSPTLLSIDIDSDDLAVWEGVGELRPFIVVIEYNPTIPADVSYTNPAGRQHGNSALAIYEFAISEKYILVAQTSSNLLFVCEERLPRTINPLDFLEAQKRIGDRYFFGYDGTLIRSVKGQSRAEEVFAVPWADIPIVQPVPAFFRNRHRNSIVNKRLMLVVSAMSLVIRRPLTSIRFAARNLGKVVSHLRASLFSRASGNE